MIAPTEIRYVLGGNQSLRVSPAALKTIDEFRQRLCSRAEAGGQLFGSVSADEVSIELASRPTFRDERGRYHFRSHPMTAKAAIANAHASGLLFLGEWHTHAERIPRPSSSDWDAIVAITKRSKLNTSRLILLIRGTATLPIGLGAFVLPNQIDERNPSFEALSVKID